MLVPDIEVVVLVAYQLLKLCNDKTFSQSYPILPYTIIYRVK